MITSSKMSSAPCSSRELAQAREEARRRRHDAHVRGHRLDDDGRDLVARRVEEQRCTASRSLYGATSVLGGVGRGDAGAVRQAERRLAGARLHQQAVGVAVVPALELDDLRRCVKARASRSADIVASVPEFTKRTISIEGIASQIRRASSTSSSLVAPYAVPRSAAAAMHGDDGGVRVAEDQRPVRADVVDVAVAVDVEDARAARRTRSPAGRRRRPERAHGARDAARHQLLRPLEDLPRARAPALHSSDGTSTEASSASERTRMCGCGMLRGLRIAARFTQADIMPARIGPRTSGIGLSPA